MRIQFFAGFDQRSQSVLPQVFRQRIALGVVDEILRIIQRKKDSKLAEPVTAELSFQIIPDDLEIILVPYIVHVQIMHGAGDVTVIGNVTGHRHKRIDVVDQLRLRILRAGY